MDARAQQFRRLRAANARSYRGGAGDEAQRPGARERRAVILPEHRHIGGINRPVSRIRLRPSAVFYVHRVTNQRVVRAAGAAQHLFLGSRATEKTTTGMNAVCKVEGNGIQALIGEPPCGRQRSLVTHQDARLTVANRFRGRQYCVRRKADLAGTGRLQLQAPVDGLPLVAFV